MLAGMCLSCESSVMLIQTPLCAVRVCACNPRGDQGAAAGTPAAAAAHGRRCGSRSVDALRGIGRGFRATAGTGARRGGRRRNGSRKRRLAARPGRRGGLPHRDLRGQDLTSLSHSLQVLLRSSGSWHWRASRLRTPRRRRRTKVCWAWLPQRAASPSSSR